VPFLCWLADLEASSSPAATAAATTATNNNLAALCARLVALREQGEREAGERLFSDTLRALGGGDPAQAALVASDPRAYQAALSVALTGVAPPGVEEEEELEEEEEEQALSSSSPAALASSRLSYGRLLRTAPPAALTPAGVAQGLAAADELASEARQRQRSSLAAFVGRAPLTAEAEASLLAGTAAARILDLLLSFETAQERLDLLPDCFTPPPPLDGAAEAEMRGVDKDDEEETEELWCTPLQLLLEVEARLRAATTTGAGGGSAGVGLFGGPGVVAGAVVARGGSKGEIGAGGDAAPVEALEELRAAIRASWLDAMGSAGGDG
jgi:hypothetical protein